MTSPPPGSKLPDNSRRPSRIRDRCSVRSGSTGSGSSPTIASARQLLAEEVAARALLPALHKLLDSDDAREGLMSFLERRAAKFTGK